MASLREWLVKHEWFILECDPGPQTFVILAMSPSGRTVMFRGDADHVKAWEPLPERVPVL